MLTKDLLINTKRAQRVYPKFLDPKDQKTSSLAKDILDLFGKYQKLPFIKLKEALSDLGQGQEKIKSGLEKLVLDKCEFTESSLPIEDLRWQAFAEAQRLRTEGKVTDIRDYLGAVGSSVDLSIQDLQSTLYSDLPDYRRISSLPTFGPIDLINRYNLAQVQGLVLRSSKTTVRIVESDIKTRRAIFRALKFHQLLVDDVESKTDELIFSLSGPLQIFSMAQAYGLKFANFLPYIIQLKKYQIDSDIKLGDKTYVLKLDQSSKLKSHYKPLKSFVPDELQSCLETFNSRNEKKYVAVTGDTLLNLGSQSYCFPDISITHEAKTEQTTHIELFHRWHYGQLKSRLETLRKHPLPSLKIGICKSIEKKAALSKLYDEFSFLKESSFEFRDFPTGKQIEKVLPH